jgi:zinc-ribbon domain
MRCWNCGQVVSEKARVCGHCEADLTDAPSAEEAAAVLELLEQMPPEVLAELGEAMSESVSALDFANRIMVGPCPSCGSEQTGDCEADPEINELLVGRCYECGQLWCTECSKALTRNRLHCDCWDEDA